MSNDYVSFGKNKGKKWSEVDENFLDWVINNFNNENVVLAAKKEKNTRNNSVLDEEIPF